MIKFKFRAECFTDVARLLTDLSRVAVTDKIKIDHMKYRGRIMPDCVVSLDANVSLDVMKAAAGSVVDGHVMQETMQTAECYTGERVYSAR